MPSETLDLDVLCSLNLSNVIKGMKVTRGKTEKWFSCLRLHDDFTSG